MSTLGVTTFLVLLFLSTHLLMSTAPIRGWLVGRLGEVGFTGLYAVVAWVTFGALVVWYAAHGSEGPGGLGITSAAWARWPALIAISIGFVLMASVVAPSAYMNSAHLVLAESTPGPTGLERITRHPFFIGLGLFGLGHALVAVHLQGTIVFGVLAAQALVGAWLLDRKLLARRGATYGDYLERTSYLPFVAIATGRQRMVLREMPWLFLVAGGIGAWGARGLHGTGFGYGAHLVIASLVLGPMVFGVVGLRRRRQKRRAERGTS